MAYDYLHLVNRLCYKLNEVPLDASTFSSAEGVYDDFKNAVNAAILDIYQEEDNEWPFGWESTTQKTTVGQSEYTKPADMLTIDWDSFVIKRLALPVYTLTQTAGIATCTITAGHQLKTGDVVYIRGADQADYTGDFTVTVTGTTTFTFPVSAGAVSPATGSIVVYLPYPSRKLTWIDWDTYRKEGYLERDTETYREENYGMPEVVARMPNNNFILSPKPNRIYTVEYEYFKKPALLVNYNDVPTIPEEYAEVIVNGAIVHGYLFRDNVEEVAIAKDAYTNGVNRMRRSLIPQSYYMRVVN